MNKKLTITFSESDLQDLLKGETFEWTVKTEDGTPINLVLGSGDCCEECGEECLPKDLKDNLCKDCL